MDSGVSGPIEHWDRFGFGMWVVRKLAGQEVIGYLGLSMPAFLSELIPAERMPAVEVGWRLHPDHSGNGYATEGAAAALRGAFETLELSEVCSAPQSINLSSARVAQRIGMTYERTATLAATDARAAWTSTCTGPPARSGSHSAERVTPPSRSTARVLQPE